MKKEVFVALILGTLLGLFGMYVVAHITSGRESNPKTHPEPSASPQKSLTTEQKNELVEPLNNVSWDDSEVTFKGNIKTGNYVFLVGNTTDTVIETTENAFETKTPAFLGIGNYSIYSEDGEKVGSSRLLAFKELVKEKELIFGTITDITAESLQMKEDKGTIIQVAYSPNVVLGSFIKDIKKVTSSDFAIGDKIVVASEAIQKGTTLALGVFVIPSDFEEQNYLLQKGSIVSINKNEVKIAAKEELTMKLSSSTKYFGIKESGALRKRTKLIDSDTTKVSYVTYLSGSDSIRSIFIVE